MKEPVGVVIGRFQIDELHEGHLALLNFVQDRYRNFLVLLGVRHSVQTAKNPLDYRVREQMIRQLYPNAVVLPVVDQSTNESWSRHVDQQIKTAFPGRSAILFGGPDNSLDAYSGKFTTQTVDVAVSTQHATARREAIANAPLSSSDFRAGIIYALQTQRPRTEVSVDIAALYDDPEERTLSVLLGRKPGEKLWRLPGGFVDPEDRSFKMAAYRECREEVGGVAGHLTYITDIISDDWRSADQDDVIHRTVLFCGWATEKFEVQAGDDLTEAKWVNINDLNERDVVPEHNELIHHLVGYLEGQGALYYEED